MTMTAYQIVWIVAQMMTRMMKIMIICAKSMTHALQILSMHVMGVKDRIQYSNRLVPPTRNGHGLCYFFALDVYYYVSLLLLALSSSRKKRERRRGKLRIQQKTKTSVQQSKLSTVNKTHPNFGSTHCLHLKRGLNLSLRSQMR